MVTMRESWQLWKVTGCVFNVVAVPRFCKVDININYCICSIFGELGGHARSPNSKLHLNLISDT